jgi:ABC-type sugar transport system ATPase subunit
MEILSVQNISKQRGKDFTLYPISFNLEQSRRLAIAGATGSGKSTLLRIIGGMVEPDGGEVRFEGKKVWGPDYTLIPGHAGIGYLSQHFELRNNYTVAEELDYANKLPQADASAIYDICRISHLLNRRTDQLSGGEKQRIVTARLLTTRPRLLLLDEPYSNLDADHRQLMKEMIRDIGEQLGTTCILVSHEPMDTLSWADEVLVLQQGRLVQQGSPQEVYHQPVNSYVAGLFGKFQLLSTEETALFNVLPGPNDTRLLVRPGYFLLATGNDGAWNGTVVRVAFYGTYYELEILVEHLLVTVSTTLPTFKKGDKILLTLHEGNQWWV